MMVFLQAVPLHNPNAPNRVKIKEKEEDKEQEDKETLYIYSSVQV